MRLIIPRNNNVRGYVKQDPSGEEVTNARLIKTSSTPKFRILILAINLKIKMIIATAIEAHIPLIRAGPWLDPDCEVIDMNENGTAANVL
jgi:hypothetical protein